MNIIAVINLITLLTGALQGLFNMVGAAIPVSDIIASHIKNGNNTWTDAERDQIVTALQASRDKADAQITAAGAPSTAGTAATGDGT